MTEEKPRQSVLLRLAAEGVVPVLGAAAGGAANVVAGNAGGPAVAMAVGKGVEKAINIFGGGIVARWQAWFARRPREEAEAAVSELAELTPVEAREQARTILLELAPQADVKSLNQALDYLSAIRATVDRILVDDPSSATGRSLPTSCSGGPGPGSPIAFA